VPLPEVTEAGQRLQAMPFQHRREALAAGLRQPLERNGRKSVVGLALSQMPAPLMNQQIVLYANTRRIDTDGVQAWPERQRRSDWPC
jgi:hypothetical protein